MIFKEDETGEPMRNVGPPRKNFTDPIQGSLEQAAPVNDAWVGVQKQSSLQRFGFSIMSLFSLGLGCRLLFLFLRTPSLGASLALLLGVLLFFVGIAGLSKSIFKYSLGRPR